MPANRNAAAIVKGMNITTDAREKYRDQGAKPKAAKERGCNGLVRGDVNPAATICGNVQKGIAPVHVEAIPAGARNRIVKFRRVIVTCSLGRDNHTFEYPYRAQQQVSVAFQRFRIYLTLKSPGGLVGRCAVYYSRGILARIPQAVILLPTFCTESTFLCE